MSAVYCRVLKKATFYREQDTENKSDLLQAPTQPEEEQI
jgi:hypothetical protein